MREKGLRREDRAPFILISRPCEVGLDLRIGIVSQSSSMSLCTSAYTGSQTQRNYFSWSSELGGDVPVSTQLRSDRNRRYGSRL
jgi:hypothetical protein